MFPGAGCCPKGALRHVAHTFAAQFTARCGFRPQSNRTVTKPPLRRPRRSKVCSTSSHSPLHWPLNNRNYENESHAIKQQRHPFPQCIEAFCVGRRCRDFASYGNIVLGCRREKRLRVVRRIKEVPTIARLKTVTNIVLPGKYFRADFGIRHRRIQHMKIAYVSALVLFASFVGQSPSAADWQIVASPSVGTGANSLVGVASAADNDVWAVGWAWNNGLSVYRTVIEHWNGATWSLIRSPNA